jgi:glycosyltransferase involved in cell wall biosynthesis
VSATGPSARVELVRPGAATLALAGALADAPGVERGSLVAHRRRDDAEAHVPARVADGRFEGELDLVLLLGAPRRTDVWDLFFQARPGAPRLRLAAATAESAFAAVRVGAGRTRRDIEPYVTARGNLSLRSRRAPEAPRPKPPPARRTGRAAAKRVVVRALNRIGLRAARPFLRGPRRRRARGAPARPKVVFVLMSAWGMGGTIRTTLSVAGHLAERHDVTVLSVLRTRESAFLPVPPGVRLAAADDRRRGARRAGVLERALRATPSVLMPASDRAHRHCSLWTDVRLVCELRRLGPDVLVGTRPGLNLLVAGLRPARCAAIGVEHLNQAERPARARDEARRRFGGLDALVVLTETDRAAARELLGDAVRLVAIPNAAPPVAPEPAALEEPVVVAAGRLSRQKGFDRLIRAFAPVAAAHPQWRLRILGDGGQRAALEALVAAHGLGDQVALPGRSRDLRSELRGASIFALSSRFEGLPMVLVEAMSEGLAIASFDCRTGPREVLDDGRTGLLVPDGDEAALTRALLELVEDPGRRRALGAAARERADEMSLRRIGPRWDALLAELLAEHAPRPRRVLSGARARVPSGHDHRNG